MGNLELTKRKQALAEFRALNQGCDVFQELADCYLRRGSFDEARACYEQAILLRPERAGGHAGLGRLALRDGDIDAAREHFRRAEEADPGFGGARAGLAAVAAEQQDFDQALSLYSQAVEIERDNLELLVEWFEVACRAGRFAELADALESYLQRHPGEVTALWCLATVQHRQGRPAEARGTLATLLTLKPDEQRAVKLLEEVAAAPAARG